ncbi:MAG: hypothetical protein IT310_05600, partial [Anaerolineales bacterium]|nr:hypothetical protein [Anaerolineales bacterium]
MPPIFLPLFPYWLHPFPDFATAMNKNKTCLDKSWGGSIEAIAGGNPKGEVMKQNKVKNNSRILIVVSIALVFLILFVLAKP